jgi:hypothetical protein
MVLNQNEFITGWQAFWFQYQLTLLCMSPRSISSHVITPVTDLELKCHLEWHLSICFWNILLLWVEHFPLTCKPSQLLMKLKWKDKIPKYNLANKDAGSTGQNLTLRNEDRKQINKAPFILENNKTENHIHPLHSFQHFSQLAFFKQF